MIQMPRRSVTRFFIPLIDVLILLFGIFLLLPIAAETEQEERFEAAADQAESAEVLERELRRRTQELQKFEELRPALAKVEQLQEEIDALRARSKESLQQRVEFKVIDIDPKTGAIFYQDPARPDAPPASLGDAKAARALIERHRREAPGRDLYYYFLYPRPETGYPTAGQEYDYRRWFAGVPNSLKGPRP
jgi:hypothetical protein